MATPKFKTIAVGSYGQLNRELDDSSQTNSYWAFLIIYLRFLDFGLGTSFRDEFSMIPIKQRRSHLYNNNVLVARGFDGKIIYKICLISNY